MLLAPAHVTDFTLGPTSLDRLLKTCTAHALPVTVRAVVYDSGQDTHRHRVYCHCPVKRPTRRAGQVLCQPDTQMRPVVYVRTADDPRRYPPIPRDSATFKALMAKRHPFLGVPVPG